MSETKKPVEPSELILYRTPTGTVKDGVLVRDEPVWLTQKAMSEVFAVRRASNHQAPEKQL